MKTRNRLPKPCEAANRPIHQLTPMPSLKFKSLILRYGLSEMYVFGSRAREIASYVRNGEALKGPSASDVDIGVRTQPEHTLSPAERVQLTIDLEDMLDVPRVDLVILDEAEPFLAADIIKGELLYAEDLDRQARYELFVLRRAGDLAPFKKQRMQMIMQEGAR